MTPGNDDPPQQGRDPSLPLTARYVDRWLSADGARWQARVPSHAPLDERAWMFSGLPREQQTQSPPAWSARTSGGQSGLAAPVVGGSGDSEVFVGSSAGTLYALDAAGGHLRWSKSFGGVGIAAAPAASASAVYVRTQAGILYAYDAASGSLKWQFNVSSG